MLEMPQSVANNRNKKVKLQRTAMSHSQGEKQKHENKYDDQSPLFILSSCLSWRLKIEIHY